LEFLENRAHIITTSFTWTLDELRYFKFSLLNFIIFATYLRVYEEFDRVNKKKIVKKLSQAFKNKPTMPRKLVQILNTVRTLCNNKFLELNQNQFEKSRLEKPGENKVVSPSRNLT